MTDPHPVDIAFDPLQLIGPDDVLTGVAQQDDDEDALPGHDVYHIVNAAGDTVRRIAIPDDHDMSDGNHSFDELYEHRRALTAVLATIGAINGDSWRSKLHHPEDGPMFPGSFIVGLELPGGTISYHYGLAYWDKFNAVPELPHAPKWDGAGPADTIRLLDAFTGHLEQAIADGRVVQQDARAAADAVVEAADDGSCCTATVAAEEEEDVRP